MFPPFFGPVTHRLRADDAVPNIAFGKLLRSPGGADWTADNFAGHVTLVDFCPNTTANPEPVARWNAMVREFSGKPVHFLWITAEDEPALLPWLALHPVEGWVFLESTGAAARSLGLEQPEAVIVGPDGRILGYDHIGSSEQTMHAALEGRITVTRPKPGRASIMEFAASGQVLLQPEPTARPRLEDRRPKLPPSYSLHVSPSEEDSEGGHFSGPDFRSRLRYRLSRLLAETYATTPARMDLAAGLDDGRDYDFAMVLPEAAQSDGVDRWMRQAIEKHYHLAVTRESRLLDAYVLTVPDGVSSVMKPRLEDNNSGFSGVSFSFSTMVWVPHGADAGPRLEEAVPLRAVGDVSMSNSTIGEFCRFLEAHLDRPLIDETHLDGHFDIAVDGNGDFIQRLRDRLGLAVTVAQRPVEVLVFRPA